MKDLIDRNRRMVVIEIATMVNDGVGWNYEFLLRPVCDEEYNFGKGGMETLAHMVACVLDRKTGMGDCDTAFVRDALELENQFVLDHWSKSADGLKFWIPRVKNMMKKLEEIYV